MDEDRNLRNRLVVGSKRDGRREYDPQAREELVQLCMKPGVSIARTAMEFGLNPNLLRGWITRHQKAHVAVSSGESEFERSRIVSNDVALSATRTCAPEVPSPFVPVVQEPVTDGQAVCVQKPAITVGLHVRLPYGVEFDVANITIDELAAVVQMLGGMPCSGSTKI
jgi:transposase